jgi:hypothetical protein
VPDFIPEQHEEGLKLGPNQIAEERGALGRDPSRRAELHGEESFVERFSKEREASWRVSSRREALRRDNVFAERSLLGENVCQRMSTPETSLLHGSKNFLILLRANLDQFTSNSVKQMLLYPLMY